MLFSDVNEADHLQAKMQAMARHGPKAAEQSFKQRKGMKKS
jgi:hypothetical protein